jgi:hypothetical protein
VGSGFRTFTAGEVLSASNVQNYLQDQVVMTFAGSAARSSAIGTANFEEGMISYLTDTDKVEAYNGTNWVQVGSSNQGLTLINTTSFSAVASQNITGVFSATYNSYRIMFNLVGTTATERDLNFRLLLATTPNSATNYRFQEFVATGASPVTTRTTGATSWTVGRASNAGKFAQYLDIFYPFETQNTQALSFAANAPTGNITLINKSYGLDVTTSYDGFQILPSADNITGSVSTYGYNV